MYNQLVEHTHKFFHSSGKSCHSSQIYLYYKASRDNFPFLKEVHSKVLGQTRVDFIKAYRQMFKKMKRHECSPILDKDGHETGWIKGEPKFHIKGDNDTCRFTNEAFIGITGNRISLIKALKDIHFKCSRRDEKYLNHNQSKVHFITVKHLPDGKWIASVDIEYKDKKVCNAKNEVIGLDLGISNYITSYNGHKIEKIRGVQFKKPLEKRIQKLQEKLKKKEIKSARRELLRRRIAKLQLKVANKRRDFIAKNVNPLICENQVIGIENLAIKVMLKSRSRSKHISDCAWYMFRKKLFEKANEYGRTIVAVRRTFKSTQTCSVCGFINEETKDGNIREWTCPNCNTHHDRDGNAAINIFNETKRILVGLSSPKPNARGQIQSG